MLLMLVGVQQAGDLPAMVQNRQTHRVWGHGPERCPVQCREGGQGMKPSPLAQFCWGGSSGGSLAGLGEQEKMLGFRPVKHEGGGGGSQLSHWHAEKFRSQVE